MREWSIRTVSKTVEPFGVPGVRIPLFPLNGCCGNVRGFEPERAPSRGEDEPAGCGRKRVQAPEASRQGCLRAQGESPSFRSACIVEYRSGDSNRSERRAGAGRLSQKAVTFSTGRKLFSSISFVYCKYFGKMSEWFKVHAWKACVPKRHRGFESPSFRYAQVPCSRTPANPVRAGMQQR